MPAPFDETKVLDFPFFSGVNAAGDVPDFSGYGNDGTPSGFAGDDSEFVDECYGQAIQLNGVNKHLVCSHNDSLSMGFSNFSIEVIFRSSTSALGAAVTKLDHGANIGFFLRITNAAGNFIYFIFRDAANFRDARVTVNFADGNIHHVVAQRNENEAYTYVDGIELVNARAGAVGAYNLNDTSDLWIGERTNGTEDFNGNILRTRIRRRAMGADEIYERFIHARRV